MNYAIQKFQSIRNVSSDGQGEMAGLVFSYAVNLK